MKPLRLTLEGLQSYREKQTIDFSKINGCGLFGIFGPTGSGKSTVLDAMTLALFGQVSRASHKTQGIINSNTEQTSVSMTFELSVDGERRTYLIERSFRRKKSAPDSSEVRTCRLIRLDGGTDAELGQVIADKTNEVDSAIKRLLGLNFEDFSRAVVLPQNQFQEFLLLDKKDKSDMLERLFCLEEYGRELSRKIAVGRRRIEDEMRTIEGSLEILQVSADSVIAELQTAVENSTQALIASQQQQLSCLEAYSAGKIVHQLTAEKLQLQQNLDGLAGQAPAINAERQQLAQAKAAEPIWPLWLQQQELATDIAALSNQLTDLKTRRQDVEQLLASSQLAVAEDLLQAGRRKTETELRVSQLERAEALTLQLTAATERRSSFEKEYLTLQEQEKSAAQKTALLQQQGQEQLIRLQDLQQTRQKLLIDPAWRQDLEKWLLLYRQRLQGDQDLLAEQVRHTDLTKQLQHLSEQVSQAELNLTAEQSAVILTIASQLQDGRPCPVCGSQVHPQPAVQQSETQELPAEAERAAMRRQLAQVEEREAASRRKIESINALLAGLKPVAATILARQPRFELLADPETELNKLHQQEIERAEIDQQLPQIESTSRLLQTQLQTESACQIRLAGLISGQQPMRQELADQQAQLERDLAALAPDCSPREALAALRQAEQQAEQHTKQLIDEQQTLERQRLTLEHQQIEDQTRLTMLQKQQVKIDSQLTGLLQAAGFADGAALAGARLEPAAIQLLAQRLAEYDEQSRDIQLQLRACDQQLQGRWLDQDSWQKIEDANQEASANLDQTKIMDDRSRQKLTDTLSNRDLRRQKENDYAAAIATRDRIAQIDALVRGNAFVEYVAEERLRAIVAEATEYLQTMTRYRFALELDADRAFVVRDQMNGGEVRLASSLSGGETFMASLALALALSSQIQIRGQSRLEFFFLDEGFGSLDNDLLDIVMDSLERISSPHRLIGLISHVPELRHRIGTHLLITPADGHHGSKISLQHG